MSGDATARGRLVLGGFGVVGVVAVVSLLSRRAGASRPAAAGGSWVDRVISRVSENEGGYDALNLNLDGAGLSFGILQWAQGTGDLGVLLAAMFRRDPQRFATIFGRGWKELLDVTAVGSRAAVEGRVLWEEPWVGRFKVAGRDPIMAAIQTRLAREGEHFRGAVEAARVLGVATERSMALLFDTSVQQGPDFAVKLADRVRALLTRRGATRVSYVDLLTTYAKLAPAHFRRTAPPTEPFPARHIEWRKTGGEWHAWAGRFDLFTEILRRRLAMVDDPELADDPVVEPTAASIFQR